jgi:hypothetical protein
MEYNNTMDKVELDDNWDYLEVGEGKFVTFRTYMKNAGDTPLYEWEIHYAYLKNKIEELSR